MQPQQAQAEQEVPNPDYMSVSTIDSSSSSVSYGPSTGPSTELQLIETVNPPTLQLTLSPRTQLRRALDGAPLLYNLRWAPTVPEAMVLTPFLEQSNNKRKFPITQYDLEQLYQLPSKKTTRRLFLDDEYSSSFIEDLSKAIVVYKPMFQAVSLRMMSASQALVHLAFTQDLQADSTSQQPSIALIRKDLDFLGRGAPHWLTQIYVEPKD